MEQYLTVKEFSERAGVSTQRIYKMLKGDLASYSKTEYGKTLISSDGLCIFGRVASLQHDETALNQDVTQDGCKNATQTVATLQHDNSEEIELLKRTVSTLQEQLAVKDEQIESLTSSNAALTSTIQSMTEQQSHLTEALRAAQALHAGTIQERLTVQEQDNQLISPEQTSSQEDETGLDPTPSEKKKSLRERLGDWIAGRK